MNNVTSRDVKKEIDQLVKTNKVFLFMKGTPEQPQCGFSAQVVQILNACGAPYASADVLADSDIRQGIKEYSDWPTIPQLFINGEFIGGCDIITHLYKSGELQTLLKKNQENSLP